MPSGNSDSSFHDPVMWNFVICIWNSGLKWPFCFILKNEESTQSHWNLAKTVLENWHLLILLSTKAPKLWFSPIPSIDFWAWSIEMWGAFPAAFFFPLPLLRWQEHTISVLADFSFSSNSLRKHWKRAKGVNTLIY